MITPADVAHVARLARLSLSAEETERMTGELQAVLGYVEHISELDLAGTEPTVWVVDSVNQLRADEPGESLTREAALANAPDPVDEGFGVPAAGS